MRLPRLLALAFAALALFLAPGCKGKCRALSEKLCDCALNSVEKDGCLRRSSQAEGGAAPTAEQEANCEALLPGCDCHNLESFEGKKACGLAR
ncbi:MAG: hypothetical protein ACYC8T_30095 [Myxococcaceae bacterium]